MNTHPHRCPFSLGASVLLLLTVLLLGCEAQTSASYLESARAYRAKGEYGSAVIQARNAVQQSPSDADARLLLGMLLIESGSARAAVPDLRKALELGARPDVVHPYLAQALAEGGQFDALIAELGGRSLADRSGQVMLQRSLGQAFLAKRDLQKARLAFDAALAADAADITAGLGLARLDAIDGKLEAADAKVEQILREAPARGDALLLKSELAFGRGDTEAGIATLFELARVQPGYLPARHMLISHLIARQRLDEAAAQIESAKKASRSDPNFVYLEALLAWRQGNLDAARSAVQQVLKAVPTHAPTLILAGSIELGAGRVPLATDHLAKAVYQDPKNVLARRLLVTAYLRGGQPTRAQDALRPLLLEAPDDPQVLALAGEIHAANGDFKAAAESLARAAQKDQDNARLRTRLAQIRIASGDTERAMRDLETIAREHAEDTTADLTLIASHMRRSEFDRALAAAQRLEKKRPQDPLPQQLIAAARLAQGDEAAGRASLERALALRPGYAPAIQALAQLDLRAGKSELARKRFQDALAQEPDSVPLLLGLANATRLAGGASAEVLKLLEKVVQLEPRNEAGRSALIDFHLRRGESAKALAAAQDANKTIPDNLRFLEQLALAQQATGNVNQAIDTLQRAAALAPKLEGPLVQLAGAYATVKDYNRAIQTLRKAVALAPNMLELRRDIALYQGHAGRPDAALAEAQSVQKEYPKNPAGLLIEGDVHAAARKWPEAVQAYRKSAALRASPRTTIRLIGALENAGDARGARTVADQWVSQHPKDAIVLVYLAGEATRKGDHQGARRYYRAAADAQPANAAVLNNLAWVSGQLGEPDALKYAEEAHRLDPHNAALLDTYGWLLLQAGEADRALPLLRKATDLAPRNDEIRLHFAKALMKLGQKGAARRELEALMGSPESSPWRKEAAKLLQEG